MRPLRPVAIALALSAPLAVAALLLVWAGWLAPGPAALLWAVATAGIAALLYRPLADLAAVGDFLLGLPDGEREPTADLGRRAGGENLAAAVRHAGRHVGQLEARVERASRLSERVFEALPDPVLLLDRRRQITRLNRAAAALFGVGATGRDLAAAVRDPALLEAVDHVLAHGGEENVEFVMAAEVERFFVCQVVVTDEIGADASVIVVLKDFTEMRRSERMRVDFVANASHEIRTPLATIAGCIETLQGPARDDPDAQAGFLEMMAQQADRMTTLVHDLLSLSRIEINEHTPPTAQVDVGLVLQRVRTAVLAGPDAARASIELSLEDGLPPVVGDDSELEQVLANLLTNAVRYGGGRVEIDAGVADMPSPGPAGRAVRIAVRDDGPGILPEHIPRLTERFYRVDTGRSRELGGTGLGLAIVKHIVNRHQGVLTVESEPGAGSTFAIFLPL